MSTIVVTMERVPPPLTSSKIRPCDGKSITAEVPTS